MNNDENPCEITENSNNAGSRSAETRPVDPVLKRACDDITGTQLDELAVSIVASAGRISAASCAWLLQVAAFDTAGGHVRVGMASTAHWLAYACGLAQRTAFDHVRVAAALAAHPILAAEMSAGRLSYSQARAIARVARPDEPALVSELIEVAQHGTVAHLEAIVRGLRSVDDAEHPSEQADREYARQRWNDDSTWGLSARLDPERGALVAAAIEQLARVEELSPADALVRLAEIGLAALADAPGTSRRHLRGHEQAAVVIHLDAAQIPAAVGPAGSAEPTQAAGSRSRMRQQRSAEPARPYARLQNGPGLPERVVRKLICAGRIRTIVADGVNVLDVGRTQRLATARQFRALLVRHDYQCATPGCANRIVDAHHVIHWLDGGRTDMTNLIPLCEPHHLGHHNGEMVIAGHGDGTFTFTRPDGRAYLAALSDVIADQPFLQTEPPIDDQYANLDPTAATTGWDGQRLDLGYAVAVLAHRRDRARNHGEQTDEAS